MDPRYVTIEYNEQHYDIPEELYDNLREEMNDEEIVEYYIESMYEEERYIREMEKMREESEYPNIDYSCGKHD